MMMDEAISLGPVPGIRGISETGRFTEFYYSVISHYQLNQFSQMLTKGCL